LVAGFLRPVLPSSTGLAHQAFNALDDGDGFLACIARSRAKPTTISADVVPFHIHPAKTGLDAGSLEVFPVIEMQRFDPGLDA
jgi:hypothetical protein